jgi:hypothetical protein
MNTGYKKVTSLQFKSKTLPLCIIQELQLILSTVRIVTWFKRYKILVRICVHFLGFTGVSLKVRASCRTVVFSMFWKGFPPPENKFKHVHKYTVFINI